MAKSKMSYQAISENVLKVLGISKLPVDESGALNFSQEQIDALNKEASNENFTAGFERLFEFNRDRDTQLEAAQSQLATAGSELDQILAENGISLSSENGEGAEGEEGEGANSSADLQGKISALKAAIDKSNATIARLKDDPEEDVSLQIHQPNNLAQMQVVHSNTHLFANEKREYNAVAGRPWNANALKLANGAKVKDITLTDWHDPINIDRINRDLDDFWRTDRNEVLTLIRDARKLPPTIGVISNIDDEIAQATILTGELTQARKKKWLPKNKQKFVPQKGKIYPIQIDAEWDGYELQRIETSWMNRFNASGSQPYKMSFVAMLVRELMVKAAEEDAMALVKGVYSPTPEDSDVPASFINRQNGFLKLALAARNVLYKPFDMGAPTDQNIYDYVQDFPKRIPEEFRNTVQFEMYMSPTLRVKYHKKRRDLFGVEPTYDPNQTTLDHYPNIRLVEFPHLDGTDFIFVTIPNNMYVLENIPTEKSMLTFERSKRIIYGMADYKLGFYVELFGAQWEEGTPIPDFKNQVFWSNNVPLLEDMTVPVEPNDTTPSVKYHTSLHIGVNTQATAITTIKDAKVGQRIILKGNGSTNASTIANSGDFDLEGSITLDEGQVIVLVAYQDGANIKFRELFRYKIAEDDDKFVQLAPNATTADAVDGRFFLTGINTGATAITNIANAVEGEEYVIKGGGGTSNATTIAKSGNFSRIKANITLVNGNFIRVFFNGDKFVEIERFVA